MRFAFQNFARKFRNVSAWPLGRCTFQEVSAICQIILRVPHQIRRLPHHRFIAVALLVA